MNLFEFLRNHKDTRVSQSYGDILEGKSDITDGMTEFEKNVYMQLKNNDKKTIVNFFFIKVLLLSYIICS